jgi:nicotinate-nucleotide pyrophosphorylase (carboxylating)
LLKDVREMVVWAEITVTESGVLCGVNELEKKARELGMEVNLHAVEGEKIFPGQKIATLTGDPVQIIKGEDCLLSLISKASGIATMGNIAVAMAGRVKIVSGAWKKIPLKTKEMVRSALIIGGVGIRLLEEPFLYLDKNYLRIFGSLEALLRAAQTLADRRYPVAVQIRGETGSIGDEAVEAVLHGAGVIMVDTGKIADLRACSEALFRKGLRGGIKLAFAGGVRIADLPGLQQEDVDIVDIGRELLDAPLLDFRYDVIKERQPWN